MNEKMKKILLGIAALALIAVCLIWFMNDGLEHIEDTNGAEDFSLTTITDQQIIDHDMGALGFGKSTNNLTGTVKFSSNKFTGVKEIMWTDVVYTSGFMLDVIDLKVNEGNFRMVVVNEGKIIKELTPADEFPMNLGELKGTTSLVIAGESADFSFRLFQHDYETFSHVD